MSERDADSEGDEMPDPAGLAERLLDAAAVGDFNQAYARARHVVEDQQDALGPLELFGYWMLLFDVATVSTVDPRVRQEAALGLLGGAIDAGDLAWNAIRESSRLDEIERLASSGDSGIELLELLAYSPDAGMRAFALTRIESAGMRALDSGVDSRPYERLMHAIGASTDAYRLESTRKLRIAGRPAGMTAVDAETPIPDLRVVALAGGHEQLRGTAARLLQRHGIEIVSIPSSREAVRRERDVVQLVQGCDLAIVLVRQITHSTSDQVRKAAERVGVRVMYSTALSAVAIERQLQGLRNGDS